MPVDFARRAIFFSVFSISLCVGPAFAWAQYAAAPATGPQASAATGSGVIVTRHRRFSLPINLLQAQYQIQAVQLLVSSDRGATWQIHQQQAANVSEFVFHAPADGEYWFASKTVDLQNVVRPEGPTRAEQRIVIDSTEPKIDLTAEPGTSGDVRLKWQVNDPLLDATTLRLEYQPAPGDSWEPVVSDQSLLPTGSSKEAVSGEHVWWPKTQLRAVDVRMVAVDKAGNRGVVSRRVFLPRVASTPEASANAPTANPQQNSASDANVAATNRFTADASATETPAPEQAAQPPIGSAPGVAWPADNRLPSAAPETQQQPPFRSSVPPAIDNPHYRPNPGDRTAANNSTDASTPDTYGRMASDVRPRLGDQTRPDINPTGVATTDTGDSSEINNVSDEHWPQIPASDPIRMTKLRHFQLEYDAEAAGAGEVAEVQLWGTEDGGQTWLKWGVHNDRQKPLEVQVDHEGIYGFRLVVVASNGLASQIPQRGAPADLWVGVDHTPPEAAITGADYGTGARAGELEIQWSASDRRLAERPITISFATGRDGPWTTIASGLAVKGPYHWKMDPSLPSQIFLRLQCHDAAGNMSEYITREPINTAGLLPRGRIRSIRPINDDQSATAAKTVDKP